MAWTILPSLLNAFWLNSQMILNTIPVIKPSTDDKILALSKLKACAGNNFNVPVA